MATTEEILDELIEDCFTAREMVKRDFDNEDVRHAAARRELGNRMQRADQNLTRWRKVRGLK